MTTIAIIGAGFCGTALAVRLLREPPTLPLKLLLINRSGRMARGVAYGTHIQTHVLNVPAGRMSAFPELPDDFVNFARLRDPTTTASSFLPRRLYGDYLEWLLTVAEANTPPQCQLLAREGTVEAITPQTAGVELLMQNGDRLQADHVVLALGHDQPVNPDVTPDSEALYRSTRYIRDPWAVDALADVPVSAPVLILGSGLTMIDVVLDLRDRGHRGRIHVLSRRGLPPQAHRDASAPHIYETQLPLRLLAKPSIRRYVRELRREIAQAKTEGHDWRDVIAALRPLTPDLWQALGEHDRRRFLRHLSPYWDAHRHRCAPGLWLALQTELEKGSVTLSAGRVIGYALRDDGVDVQFRRRGRSSSEHLQVGTVINCTGPAIALERSEAPLLQSLLQQGAATSDAIGLGFRIDAHYGLIDRDGRRTPRLHYIGPLLRGRDWEATAIPELSQHVARLHGVLRREIHGSKRRNTTARSEP